MIGISRLIFEVLDDQNLFTDSNIANWHSSYVQFCSGGHFSKRAEAAWWRGKMNHLKERKEKGKNTLEACVSVLLDISQSDSVASRTAAILILVDFQNK